MIGERWVPIRGFPDYDVSDAGRVRSRRANGALSPVSASEVETIRLRAAAGECAADIARSVGRPYYTIKRIIAGKTHRLGPRLLRASAALNGYRVVTMYATGKAPRREYVHTLVAEAFLGQRPDGGVVNHLDANPLNNRADNLEWTTYAGNCHHAIRMGRWDPHELSRKGHAARWGSAA